VLDLSNSLVKLEVQTGLDREKNGTGTKKRVLILTIQSGYYATHAMPCRQAKPCFQSHKTTTLKKFKLCNSTINHPIQTESTPPVTDLPHLPNICTKEHAWSNLQTQTPPFLNNLFVPPTFSLSPKLVFLCPCPCPVFSLALSLLSFSALAALTFSFILSTHS